MYIQLLLRLFFAYVVEDCAIYYIYKAKQTIIEFVLHQTFLKSRYNLLYIKKYYVSKKKLKQ